MTQENRIHATGPLSPMPDDFGDFRQMSFHDVLISRKMAEGPGVYAILLRGGERILDALGYPDGPRPHLTTPLPGFTHMYTGCSGGLRSRIREHSAGDARVSTFRRTLLAAEHFCSAISATGRPLLEAQNSEYSLDLWLAMNGWFVFWRTKSYECVEAQILAQTASPLNVTGRKTDVFAKRLMGLRSAYEDRPVRRHCEAAVEGLI